MQSATIVEQLRQARAVIASLREMNAVVQGEFELLQGRLRALQSTLNNYIEENELLKRKLFGTKSERTDTCEFQLMLKGLFEQEQELHKQYEQMLSPGHDSDSGGDKPEQRQDQKPRPKPKGRRNLALCNLARIDVDIDDPELSKQGPVIGRKESYRLVRIPGCFKVLVTHTAIYGIKVNGRDTVLGATVPPRAFERSMCDESVYAWLAVEKFGLGVPHYRLEQQLKHQDESLDRGTMSRYMQDLGGLLGCTVVNAMFQDARTNCHVLSTDATGAAIQPVPTSDKRRQSCKKGHFFTVVADCDHVLYHYTQSHTSKVVEQLFEGFTGLLQSDASSVYDILERGPPGSNDGKLKLVGCWAHCRRYFFEAAVSKHAGAVEGLRRIREIFGVIPLLWTLSLCPLPA